MRRIALLFVFFILIPSVTALCQQASQQAPPQQSFIPPPVAWTGPTTIRDPQALTAVQASLAAMGGSAAISQVQSYVVSAQDQHTMGGTNSTGNAVWEVAGSEFVSKFAGPNGTTGIGTGHGSPFRLANGSPQKVQADYLRALFVPVLVGPMLSQQFQNQTYSFQYVGTATLNGANVTVVKTSSQLTKQAAQATLQTWYFDSASNLPVRIEYRLPATPYIYVHKLFLMVLDLSGYQPVSGVLYPTQAVVSMAGKQLRSMKISSIGVNQTISPSDFDAPGGGAQ